MSKNRKHAGTVGTNRQLRTEATASIGAIWDRPDTDNCDIRRHRRCRSPFLTEGALRVEEGWRRRRRQLHGIGLVTQFLGLYGKFAVERGYRRIPRIL
jgi:hypothetical protein